MRRSLAAWLIALPLSAVLALSSCGGDDDSSFSNDAGDDGGGEAGVIARGGASSGGAGGPAQGGEGGEAGEAGPGQGGSSGSATSGGSGGNATSGGSAGTPAGGVPIEELPDLYAGVICNLIDQCLEDLLLFFPQPDCQTEWENRIANGDLGALEAAVEAGTVSYDPTGIQACLDAIEAAGCDAFTRREPEPCEAAVGGSVALGDPCSIDAECEGRAFCDRTENSCPGVCAVLRQEGEDCEANDDCDDGLTCQSNACEPPAGAGELCRAAGPDCELGYICLGETTDVAGSCGSALELTTLGEGETCDPATLTLCEPDLSCTIRIEDQVTTFACQEKLEPGADCPLGVPEPCSEGEFCDIGLDVLDGTCRPWPEEGEDCAAGNFRSQTCALGLRCVGGVCVAPKQNGQECSGDLECYGEICDSADGACLGDRFCTGE